LTAQEREVLRLSATGRSVLDVAEALEQSPEVIRRSLASAIDKLGAHSKLEAIIIVLRHGLVDRPDL
jgi:DNA-binding NarL/FixJ family response regulator